MPAEKPIPSAESPKAGPPTATERLARASESLAAALDLFTEQLARRFREAGRPHWVR